MLNIDEINKEILMLEKKDTTYAVCEKLACLYTVRDHLTAQEHKQPIPLDVSGDSEFFKTINGRESVDVWCVIDELMSTLKVINPRLYEGVIRKLTN